jgi:hypothetical protein
MTMAWSGASLGSILPMVAAILFAIAGVVNLAGRGEVRRDFVRWGYPPWFHLLCGALELLSAALLAGQQTRIFGLTLASVVMIAALFTLLRNREPFGHLAPAVLFSALIVATVMVRG